MYLENLIDDIDSTHKNMGNLVAVCLLTIKAHKFTFLISPSGCGKSTAMKYVETQFSDTWSPLYLTVASLENKADRLTSFRSGIFVDDLAAVPTDYARQTTIVTLSQLTYEHRVEPSAVGADFSIEDFYGGALIGIQPKILKNLILNPVWDSHVRDKALRYYHLYRPTEPFIGLPPVNINHGLEIEDVEHEPDIESGYWQELYRTGLLQWSKARAKQHCIDYLKAVAAYDGRYWVEEQDYKFLIDLFRPMAVEEISTFKDDLESDAVFDNNFVALLTEYYSYGGSFCLAHICQDFKIKLAMAYRIMQNQNQWRQITKKSPIFYAPTDKLLQELERYGLEIYRNEE